LQLKDLENVEKRLEKVKRAAKTGNKEAIVEETLLNRIRETLLQAKSVRTITPQNNDEEVLMEGFQLITAKPVLYVCNVDENSAVNGNKYVDQVRELVKDEDAEVIVLSVGAEADITELESYEERQVFLEDMGLTEPGASVLIRAAYKLLKQQTYFTAGVKRLELGPSM
jgi:ribosome-binding ATPase YchF (GTP1/OBG family)